MASSLTIMLKESGKVHTSFHARFESESRRDAVLEHLQHVGLPPQLQIRTSHLNDRTDWAWKTGTFVPLRLITVDHPIYVAMLTLEDQTYMDQYDTTIFLTDTDQVHQQTIGEFTGWALQETHLLDAIDFLNEYNDLGIPQSDTLEWDSFYDIQQQRILFYPYLRGHVGEQR